MMTNTLSSNKPFFLSLTLLSITMAVSSSSWIMLWVALELNMFVFLSIIMSDQTKPLIESTVKYLITQSTASIILLLSMLYNMKYNNNFMIIISTTMIILKLGMAPFHQWMLMVIKPLSWWKSLMLLTLQKIIPLMLMINLLNTSNMFMLLITSLTNAMWGALAGLKQTTIQPLLAFSSISHMGWIMTIMNYSSPISLSYFMIYMMTLSMFIMSITMWKTYKFWHPSNLLNKPNLTSMINLLSLGGLPPLLGFSAKWLAMNYIISPLLLSLLISSAMMTLFFYLSITINMMINPQTLQSQNINISGMMMIFLNMSLSGMFIMH